MRKIVIVLEKMVKRKKIAKTTTTYRDLKSLLEKELRKCIRRVPLNEEKLKEIVHALLLNKYPSVRRERRISFAGVDFIVDFSLNSSVALEVKLLKKKSYLGKIVNEILADASGYRFGKPRFKRIAFLIYDACGAVNEDDIQNDIEENFPYVSIIVSKH